MKSAQKARKLFLLVETADEVHERHTSTTQQTGDVWGDAKEQVAYENVQRDVLYAKRTLKHSARHRVSLARWLALAVAILSVEEYIRKFNPT